ncbi:MAG: S9 family peptidase [Planctomycetes bacterium]|nr:S9 family peptidase [Planctomycetota bacterium]
MLLPWIALVLPASFSLPSARNLPADGYKLPPKEIVDLLDAPPTPQALPSPRGEWMLFVERPAMPSIEDVVRPWVPLAGMRVDPALNATQQLSFATGLEALDIASGAKTRIELPARARILDTRWSHKGARLALTLAGEHEVELWFADANTGVARKLVGGVNAVLGSGFAWMGDGERLLVNLVPKDRGPAPERGARPAGPSVQETAGTKTALRTYQDLLADAHRRGALPAPRDEPARDRRPAQGRALPRRKPALFADVELSPDDRHLLVTTLKRPFSYVLPAGLFPQTIEVWNLKGERERLVAEVPLGESIPQEGVRTGPRNVQWHAAAPATLVWAEALDGGDPKTKAEFRDRWMIWPAPFVGEARLLVQLWKRAQGLQFLPRPDHVIVTEYDRDRRWTRTTCIDALDPAKDPLVLDDRSTNDRYGDPGAPVTIPNESGKRVVRLDGNVVYRSGRGASAEGERPFLDRFDLRTKTSERLWQCAPKTYESLIAVHASSASTKPVVVTSYETPTETPNFRLRDLGRDTTRALTAFTDPQPALRGVKQELVKYQRADGVALSGTLYLPPEWKEGTRLPLFVWAYPLEFTDAATAGQVSGSPYRFVRVRGASQLLFALHGWAVLDNASMPVVGDPETMNDTFLRQIVAASQAAIDHCVERGVADREKVAVGGHSYGAFMTANLLAHCDLFKAGVARSGAYNRTLTPFGFQSERRTIWEAPKSYLELSPFLAAEKVNEPLLLIHGEKDNNMGTFPIQSERMYAAVKGNGGTARLVVLPGESHGYSARESVLHTVAEMFEWCDRWVRDAQSAAAGARGAVEAGAR